MDENLNSITKDKALPAAPLRILEGRLGRVAFDLASMKNIQTPIEDIDLLESIWVNMLDAYLEQVEDG